MASTLHGVCRFASRWSEAREDASACLHAAAREAARMTQSTAAGVLLPVQIARIAEEQQSRSGSVAAATPLGVALLNFPRDNASGASGAAAPAVVSLNAAELKVFDLHSFPGMPMTGRCACFLAFCVFGQGQSEQPIAIVWMAKVVQGQETTRKSKRRDRTASSSRLLSSTDSDLDSDSDSDSNHSNVNSNLNFDSNSDSDSDRDADADGAADPTNKTTSYTLDERMCVEAISSIVRSVVGRCAAELELDATHIQFDHATSELERARQDLKHAQQACIELEDSLENRTREVQQLLDLEADALEMRLLRRCELDSAGAPSLSLSDEPDEVMSKLRISLGKCVGLRQRRHCQIH